MSGTPHTRFGGKTVDDSLDTAGGGGGAAVGSGTAGEASATSRAAAAGVLLAFLEIISRLLLGPRGHVRFDWQVFCEEF